MVLAAEVGGNLSSARSPDQALHQSGSVRLGSDVDKTWATSLGREAAQPTVLGPLQFWEIAFQCWIRPDTGEVQNPLGETVGDLNGG
jgi:hypothetical protein